jgi:holo-[acyl-carrier protein] synthase
LGNFGILWRADRKPGMIIGIGVDIIEVERIQKLVERNPRFLARVFTDTEIKYSEGKKNRFQHLAARFAAKEAFFKALGKKIKWTDVGIVNLPSGKPELELKDEKSYAFDRTHVSLSHIQDYAIAYVVLERKGFREG